MPRVSKRANTSASSTVRFSRSKEFTQAREQLKGGYILGPESTSSRMNAIGRRKLLIGNTQTESEVIDRINAITQEEVERIMKDVLTSKYAVSLVGKGADELVI